MTHKSLDDLLIMGIQPLDNLGPIDPHLEGSYRRGYHQAVSAIATIMQHNDVTAETLDEWVVGAGMAWRKDTRLDQQIVPPVITNKVKT
jgi:hypothetical protein